MKDLTPPIAKAVLGQAALVAQACGFVESTFASHSDPEVRAQLNAVKEHAASLGQHKNGREFKKALRRFDTELTNLRKVAESLPDKDTTDARAVGNLLVTGVNIALNVFLPEFCQPLPLLTVQNALFGPIGSQEGDQFLAAVQKIPVGDALTETETKMLIEAAKAKLESATDDVKSAFASLLTARNWSPIRREVVVWVTKRLGENNVVAPSLAVIDAELNNGADPGSIKSKIEQLLTHEFLADDAARGKFLWAIRLIAPRGVLPPEAVDAVTVKE